MQLHMMLANMNRSTDANTAAAPKVDHDCGACEKGEVNFLFRKSVLLVVLSCSVCSGKIAISIRHVEQKKSNALFFCEKYSNNSLFHKINNE